MERRVLLAIFLAFLVLYVWQALFVKPVPKPASGPAPLGEAAPAPGPSAEGSGAPTSGAPSTGAPSTPAAGPKPATSTAAPLVADSAEHDMRVETRDVIAVFTNRGARLKSWRLKHYL